MPTDIAKVLKAVSPSASAEFIAASANAGAIMEQYKITSPNAQAQLIGHMAVECAGFKTFAENLNYSAKRLTQVWPSRFPSLVAAEPYAKNPKALANKVYNGRMGNRAGSDDGWNYRGSGGLQHTGASEFARVERRTGLPVTTKPDMLRQAAAGAVIWRAACSYFADRGCIEPADKGQTDVVCVKVNGGKNGLADRKIMVARASAALMHGTVLITEATTLEQAGDAKRKAKQATAAAPAGGAAGGASTDQATKPATQQPDKPAAPAEAPSHTAGIVVGAIIFAVIAIVAVAFWRKHLAMVAEIETTQMKALDDRLNAAPVPEMKV